MHVPDLEKKCKVKNAKDKKSSPKSVALTVQKQQNQKQNTG